MPNPGLFMAFQKRAAHHGIEVKWEDDPYDTYIIVLMKMLDYIEFARQGILVGRDVQPNAQGKIDIISR